jgi:hypothetical protein
VNDFSYLLVSMPLSELRKFRKAYRTLIGIMGHDQACGILAEAYSKRQEAKRLYQGMHPTTVAAIKASR